MQSVVRAAFNELYAQFVVDCDGTNRLSLTHQGLVPSSADNLRGQHMKRNIAVVSINHGEFGGLAMTGGSIQEVVVEVDGEPVRVEPVRRLTLVADITHAVETYQAAKRREARDGLWDWADLMAHSLTRTAKICASLASRYLELSRPDSDTTKWLADIRAEVAQFEPAKQAWRDVLNALKQFADADARVGETVAGADRHLARAA